MNLSDADVPLDEQISSLFDVAKDKLDQINRKSNKKKKVKSPNDVSILLAREMSFIKYVYHNIHLQTSLNYKDDCNL